MNKLEALLDAVKSNELNLNDLLGKKVVVQEKKKCNVVLWIFAIIGVIVAVAGIAYALYRYFKPDYLEDFEDEFEDEFDDEDYVEDDEDSLFEEE